MFHRNFIVLAAVLSIVEASLKEFIKFQQVEFENLPSELDAFWISFSWLETFLFKGAGNFPFIPYNNVPQGFAPFVSKTSSKVFIAVPRRSPGVPSTLNYVALEAGKDLHLNPKLLSYPNYETNELDVGVRRFHVRLTRSQKKVQTRRKAWSSKQLAW